jgi:transposase-like protein
VSIKSTFQSKVLEVGNKTFRLDGTKSIEEQIKNFNFDTLNLGTANLDTQVKMKQQKAPRRKFSNAYKLQILNALDACKNGNERVALLRKEGLYYARVSTWKKQFQHGQLTSNKTPKSILLTQQLTREVTSLKKKLSQAEAIIDLQKKISELLSINILDHDVSETSS